MTILRLLATPFKQGQLNHVIKKRVMWHPQGITAVRRFTIEPCDALPTRELVGVPISPIKDNDPEASNPFKIPEEDCGPARTPFGVRIIEAKIENMKNAVILEKMVTDLVEEPDPYTMDWELCDANQPDTHVFRYTKGEMRMWCE